MTLKFKCKQCAKIYTVNLLDSEYYLPERCPICGYWYREDAALKDWIEQARRFLLEQKRRDSHNFRQLP